MANSVSAHLRKSTNKVRKATDKAIDNIIVLFSKSNKKRSTPKLQTSHPDPDSFTHVTHLSPTLVDPNVSFVANGSICDAPALEMQLELYSCQLVAAKNALQAAQTTNFTLENEVQMLQLQLNRSAELTATNHALREEILEWQNREAAQVETVQPRRTFRERSRQKLREEVVRLTAQVEAAGREQEALERMLSATRNHDRDVQCVELFMLGLAAAAEREQLGDGVVDGDEGGDGRTTWNNFAVRDL